MGASPSIVSGVGLLDMLIRLTMDAGSSTMCSRCCRLFDKPSLVAAERGALLAGRPPGAREDAGPLVCSCFAVGRNTLRRAIAQHALSDTRQVGARLRAGTNCGSCLPEIRALLAERAGRYADTA